MSIIKPYEHKVLSSNSRYIDPLSCDSQVSYKVVDARDGAWGSVLLSDCTRRLEWYFNGNDSTGTQKIDAAIEMLQEFKQAYLDGQVTHKKLVAASRKRNAKSTSKPSGKDA